MPFSPDRPQLPNIIRETLLQKGRGSVALVLDGLWGIGVKPGGELTIKDTYILLNTVYGVSLYTIRKALGDQVFKSRIKPRDRHTVGRPPRLYLIPSLDELRSHLEVFKHSPTDKLEQADLRSLTTYRLALHRELIARNFKPAAGEMGMLKASRALLTKRLGVCVRTLKRYEEKLQTYVLEQIDRVRVTLKHIYAIPEEKPETFQPVWLEASKGDEVIRFPYLRSLAAQCLQMGYEVVRCRRGVNLYAPYDPKTHYLRGKYAAFIEY